MYVKAQKGQKFKSRLLRTISRSLAGLLTDQTVQGMNGVQDRETVQALRGKKT